MFRRPRTSTIVGLALAAGMTWLWAATIIQTGRWPAGDGPHMLGIALRLAHLLTTGAWGELSWSLPSLVAPHPPGAYLPGLLAYALSPDPRTAHLLAAGGALLLAWDGIRRMTGSAARGLLGLVWLAASPLVWQQAELYGVDLFAAVAVLQSVSHLVASRGLRHGGHAVGWGAWMGVAFLTKYTAPFFLWLPCVLVGLLILVRGRWGNLARAFGAWCLVAGPWFLGHGDDVLAYAGASNTATPELAGNTPLVTGAWWAPHNVSWYPAALLHSLGTGGTLALGLAALVPGGRATPRAARWFAWATVLGGWLLLAPQLQRQVRYLLPMLPMAAVLLSTSRLAPLLAVVGIISVHANYLHFSDPTEAPAQRKAHFPVETAGQTWPQVPEALSPMSEDPNEWRLDPAIARLAAHTPASAETVGLLAPSMQGPGAGLVLYRLAAAGYPWHLSSVAFLDRGGPTPDGAALPMWNQAALFVAPFAIGDWPERRFQSVLVITEERDTRSAAWLRSTGFVLAESVETRHGYVGGVYTRESSAD